MTTRDEKSLVDQALDTFVFAPIGFLLEARELIPKLADRGRGQVALARLAGKVAQNRHAATATTPTAEPSPDPAEVEPLPIDGYDDLSAPQLLPMLDTLQPDDLSALMAHEQSHRGRATVVNRIRQLQG